MQPGRILRLGSRKGIRVVATGDFTHPAWAAGLKDKLTDAGNLLKLRQNWRKSTPRPDRL